MRVTKLDSYISLHVVGDNEAWAQPARQATVVASTVVPSALPRSSKPASKEVRLLGAEPATVIPTRARRTCLALKIMTGDREWFRSRMYKTQLLSEPGFPKSAKLPMKLVELIADRTNRCFFWDWFHALPRRCHEFVG